MPGIETGIARYQQAVRSHKTKALTRDILGFISIHPLNKASPSAHRVPGTGTVGRSQTRTDAHHTLQTLQSILINLE